MQHQDTKPAISMHQDTKPTMHHPDTKPMVHHHQDSSKPTRVGAAADDVFPASMLDDLMPEQSFAAFLEKETAQQENAQLLHHTSAPDPMVVTIPIFSLPFCDWCPLR
eukprot:7061467-Pyramimonas_sp.AAC.1